jgi:type IV/VI secretion system ImpK/VasF family protein
MGALKIMSAELYSASLVSRFAVPGNTQFPQGYYRSKLYINTSTTNPLVAAAGPLLSLLERLCVSPTLPPINSIRSNIQHELNAFHSKLASKNYADEFVVIASYLLSATIDELLGKNYLRLYGKPAEFKSFTPSSFDGDGPQKRFFDIINHIKEQTSQYLDLLELSYYCLIAGFEGEKHLLADGRQTLDNLIEELFQLIQKNRGNKTYRLFKIQSNKQPESVSHKRIILSTLITLASIALIYLASHVLLEYKAKALLVEHASLTSTMDD